MGEDESLMRLRLLGERRDHPDRARFSARLDCIRLGPALAFGDGQHFVALWHFDVYGAAGLLISNCFWRHGPPLYYARPHGGDH
jgi:hypothetical protein